MVLTIFIVVVVLSDTQFIVVILVPSYTRLKRPIRGRSCSKQYVGSLFRPGELIYFYQIDNNRPSDTGFDPRGNGTSLVSKVIAQGNELIFYHDTIAGV